jgi:hypothetical protein
VAVNYDVQADVVDIQRDSPSATDAFLVETNVLYWMAYSRSGLGSRPPRAYQVTAYPAFLRAAMAAESKLCRCELSLAELASLIERKERELHSSATGHDWDREPKEYRHNLVVERSRVTAEIEAAWSLVSTLCAPFPFTIDGRVGQSALDRLMGLPVDGYDSLLLEAIGQGGICQVLTDDGDFCTVPGITVFTANRRVVEAAANAGRLVVR